MLMYNYSGMTCDGCGKVFPIVSNELTMQYRFERLW